MRVITTREIVRKTKTYFDLAENERIAVKRGNKYVNMIVADTPDKVFLDEEWMNEYFAIPVEYRCNPFDISPSGDIFWADKRNVEQLDQSIKQAREGKITRLSREKQKEIFGIQ
jgi:hypothetical protein